MNLAEQYIKDVAYRKIVVCDYVRFAVQRHLDDLKTGKDRGIYFDPEAGEHAIVFVGLLRHTKGEKAGEHFDLQPFQAFALYMIFGWRRMGEARRFTKT